MLAYDTSLYPFPPGFSPVFFFILLAGYLLTRPEMQIHESADHSYYE